MSIKRIMYKAMMIMSLIFIPLKSFALATAQWTLNGTDLNYDITHLEYPDSSITLNCKWLNSCWVEMRKGSDTYAPLVWQQEVPNSKGTSAPASRLVKDFNDKALPKQGVINNYKNECILIYLRGDARMGSESGKLILIGNSCYGTLTPVPPPQPVPAQCSLDSDIMLNHGVLQEDKVNGNTANFVAHISCNKDATVKLSVVTPSNNNKVILRSDGSLESLLTINGVQASSGINVSVPGVSGASVTFTSTLNVVGNLAAGNFSGAAVAVLNVL